MTQAFMQLRTAPPAALNISYDQQQHHTHYGEAHPHRTKPTAEYPPDATAKESIAVGGNFFCRCNFKVTRERLHSAASSRRRSTPIGVKMAGGMLGQNGRQSFSVGKTPGLISHIHRRTQSLASPAPDGCAGRHGFRRAVVNDTALKESSLTKKKQEALKRGRGR